MVKVGSHCVGIDKIGHFFDNGYLEYVAERSKGATGADKEGVAQETMTPSFYAETVSGLYNQVYFAARIWRTILKDASWTGEYTSADSGTEYFAMLTFNRFRIISNTSMRAEGVLSLQAADGSMIDLDVAGETTLRAAGKVRGVQVTGAVDGVNMKLISDAHGPVGETRIQLSSVRETTLSGTWHGGADGSGALQGSLELARF